MVTTQEKELIEFWEKLKKSTVTLKDVDTLQKLLGRVFLKIKELEESRDNWKDRALIKSLEKIDEWAKESFNFNEATKHYEIDGIKIPIDKLKKRFK